MADKSNRTRWTREEQHFLERHIHDRTWAQLARHFRRSEAAVKLKAYRLGMTRDGELTYGRDELASALGVTVYRVRRWVASGWLLPRADGRYTRRAVQAFLAAHNDEIDLRRVQPETFWQIVSSAVSDGGEEEVGE